MKSGGAFILLLLMMVKAQAGFDKKTNIERDPFMQSSQLIQNGESLQDFPLDSLRLVGTIHQNSQQFALIRDLKDRIYTLKLGDLIGMEQAKITYIAGDEIQVTWFLQQQIFTGHLGISTTGDEL